MKEILWHEEIGIDYIVCLTQEPASGILQKYRFVIDTINFSSHVLGSRMMFTQIIPAYDIQKLPDIRTAVSLESNGLQACKRNDVNVVVACECMCKTSIYVPRNLSIAIHC